MTTKNRFNDDITTTTNSTIKASALVEKQFFPIHTT